MIGGLLTGWGTFNMVEGVVDHHLLQIHHMMSTGPTLRWDLAFLAWGAFMLVGDLALMRAGIGKPSGSPRPRCRTDDADRPVLHVQGATRSEGTRDSPAALP